MVESYPREAWTRLGRLLKQRRPQIDPRFRVRKEFAKVAGVSPKTVQDIENGYRPGTFGDETLSQLEISYRLRPGSLQRTLAGEDLDPLPVGGGGRPDDPDPERILGSLLPHEWAVWSIPELSWESRIAGILGIREAEARSRHSNPAGNPAADEAYRRGA